MAALIINNTPSPSSHELGETTLPRSVTARWEITNEGDEGAFVRAYITYASNLGRQGRRPVGSTQPWDHDFGPLGPHEIKWVGPGATSRFTAFFLFPAEAAPSTGNRTRIDPYDQHEYLATIEQLAWVEWTSGYSWPTVGWNGEPGWWPQPRNYKEEVGIREIQASGEILRVGTTGGGPPLIDRHLFSMHPIG